MRIAVGKIIVKDNPRKTFDDADIKALSDSMNKYGLISPIAVRKIWEGDKHTGFYELVAGERRLRASKLLEWVEIEANVLVNRSEEDIERIRIVENIQRKDLHPYEEAESILKLMDDDTDVKRIAAELGKSERYVHNRLSLLNLNTAGIELYLSRVIKDDHALQIARLRLPDQERVLKELIFEDGDKKYCRWNARQLRSWVISNVTARLHLSNFDKSDKTLNDKIRIACVSCNARSGYNQSLFHDINADDVCFNTDCFKVKLMTHCERVEAKYLADGFKIKRLTNVLFDDLDYDNDYLYRINDRGVDLIIDKARSDGRAEEITLGIYFYGTTIGLIGRVVQILPGEETKEEGGDDRKGIYAIRLGKAAKAYTNTLLRDMAALIGERPTDLLLPPTVRYLGAITYKEMPELLRSNIRGHYRWDLKPTPEEEYHYNTREYNFAKLCELMLFVLTYGGMKSDASPVYKTLLMEMAKGWGVDVESIKGDIEIKFDVKL